MHDSHRPKIQPQRQCLEPIRDLPLPGSALHLVQKCLVLRPISGLVMISQELAGVLRIRRHPGDGVELVIPHDAERRARLHHAPHEIDRRQLLRSTIHQIPDENRRAAGMAKSPRLLAIA